VYCKVAEAAFVKANAKAADLENERDVIEKNYNNIKDINE
jgi:hypothetical protein